MGERKGVRLWKEREERGQVLHSCRETVFRKEERGQVLHSCRETVFRRRRVRPDARLQDLTLSSTVIQEELQALHRV